MRGDDVNRLRDWWQRVRELDQEGELGLFSWTGCVPLLGVGVSFASVLMGAAFVIVDDTNGLLLVIVILLAVILLLAATKGK